MTNRKPGRPRIDRPPKQPYRSRPLKIDGGVTIKVTLPPGLLATIDAAAASQGVTRAGWIRKQLEQGEAE